MIDYIENIEILATRCKACRRLFSLTDKRYSDWELSKKKVEPNIYKQYEQICQESTSYYRPVFGLTVNLF